MSLAFDPWDYYEELRAADVPEELARIQSNAFRDCMRTMAEQNNQNLATKTDIAELSGQNRETVLRLQKGIKESEGRLQKEIKEVEGRLQKEIKEVEGRLQKEIKEVEGRLQKEIIEVEARLQKEMGELELRLVDRINEVDLKIQKVKYDLLKWQIGLAITLSLIMAKGFNWLGF